MILRSVRRQFFQALSFKSYAVLLVLLLVWVLLGYDIARIHFLLFVCSPIPYHCWSLRLSNFVSNKSFIYMYIFQVMTFFTYCARFVHWLYDVLCTYCALAVRHIVHWLYDVLCTGCTTYCALAVRRIVHVLCTGCTTYCALTVRRIVHWLYEVLCTDCTTYCALTVQRILHVLCTGCTTYFALTVWRIVHWLYDVL